MTGVDAAKGVIEGLEADRLRKTEPATPTQCQFEPTKVPSLYDGFDECFLFLICCKSQTRLRRSPDKSLHYGCLMSLV